MTKWWRNEQGITLAELLGALAILTIVVGTITSVSLYANKGVQHSTNRETVIMESRTILNHIVQAMRSETARATQDETHVLKLDYHVRDDESGELVPNGNYTYYTFNPSTDGNGTFSLSSKKGTNTLVTILSEHVQTVDIEIEDLPENKYRLDITLEMQLDNGSTYKASTVVYSPNLMMT